MVNELLGATETVVIGSSTLVSSRSSIDKANEQIKKPIQLSDTDMAKVEMMNIDKSDLSVAVDTIGVLTQSDVEGLMTQLAKNATNFDIDRYTRVSSNAIGKYGITIQQLEALKILRPGSSSRLEIGMSPDTILANPGNWDGRGPRPDNLEEFLSNTVLQEKTMFQLLNNEYGKLVSNAAVDSSDTKEIVAGMISVSLIVGSAKTLQWRLGKILEPALQIICDRNFDYGRYAVMILGAR